MTTTRSGRLSGAHPGFAWFGLALGYFSYFGLLATLQPYLANLFLEHGVPQVGVGAAVALLYVLAGLSPLVASGLAMRLGATARAVAVAAGLGALAVSLALVARQRGASSDTYVFALALLTALYAPINAMLDAAALRSCAEHRWSFGQLRLMGSVGYILTATGMGRLLPPGAVSHAVHVGIAVLCAVVFLCALSLPAAPLGEAADGQQTTTAQAGPVWPAPGALWALLAACGLHYASFGPFMFGFTLYGQSVGLSAAAIGIAWSVGVMSEVAAFSVASRAMQAFGWRRLLAAAFVAGALRWTLLASSPSVAAFFVSQLLHGPAFALFYACAMAGLTEVSPAARSQRSQAVFCALVAGLASGPAMLLAGYASAHFSLASMFWWVLPLNAGSLALLALAYKNAPPRA